MRYLCTELQCPNKIAEYSRGSETNAEGGAEAKKILNEMKHQDPLREKENQRRQRELSWETGDDGESFSYRQIKVLRCSICYEFLDLQPHIRLCANPFTKSPTKSNYVSHSLP